jgi:hypothetical protein
MRDERERESVAHTLLASSAGRVVYIYVLSFLVVVLGVFIYRHSRQRESNFYSIYSDITSVGIDNSGLIYIAPQRPFSSA